MRVNDIKKVRPAKDNVVVKHVELDSNNDLYLAKSKQDPKNAELDFGEVLAVGPKANEPEFCPGLKVGNTAAFNLFAGSHIATSDFKQLYKIMSGYSLVAVLDDISKLNEDTIHPTANRLLIAVKFVEETDEGLFIPEDQAKDPRLEDLDYGVVIKIGPSCKLGYKVGDIVAYQPYAGENIRKAISVDKPALRVLIEEDVLLAI